MKVIFTNN